MKLRLLAASYVLDSPVELAVVAEHHDDLVLGLDDLALLLGLLVYVLLRSGEQVLNGLSVVLVLNQKINQFP